MRTLLIVAAAMVMGCPSPPPPRPSPRRDPGDTPTARRSPPRTALTLQRCPAAPGAPVALPSNIRRVTDLGRGLRLVVAGVRASERRPCAGACPAPKMTLALVGGDGAVCWRVALPAEHRLGPVARPGKTVWVAGPKQVFAVSWRGKLLASQPLDGVRLGPVALADGSAVVVDGPGYLVAFRATGQPRWRKKPKTAERILALHRRPGGGISVAFPSAVRTYDVDGVRRLKLRLPNRATERWVLGVPGALWVGSLRGAYRVVKKGVAGDVGRVRHRRPERAPADGRVFAAALGADGTLYALVAERGLYPVRLVAVTPNDALDWSRPFTGARPAGCRLRVGPRTQLGLVCPGGRVVVRNLRGITRFDETGKQPRLSLGPAGRYAVAFEQRRRDMSLTCWVRRYGPTGETAVHSRLGGKCQPLWHDGAGRVYLGTRRLDK